MRRRKPRDLGWRMRRALLAATLAAALVGPATPATALSRPGGPLALASGSYFGVTANENQNDGINGGKAEVLDFEADIGRKIDIDNRFYVWGDQLPTAQEVWDVQNGRIPMITWGKRDTLNILSGAQDAWILAQAGRLANLGGPFFLRFFGEPDGAYQANIVHTPADYIAAWRHVHNLFLQAGATNAVWVWCPTANSYLPSSPNLWPPDFYPGDTFVDWVAADGYNWYPTQPTNGGRSFKVVFQNFYDWAITTGKPIMIAETGALEGNPGKAQWLTDAWQVMKTDFTMIQAFVYFDTMVLKNGVVNDWRVAPTPATFAAYKAGASDPYFNPLSVPDTNPPSTPGKPAGNSTVPGQIALSWGASTDDHATTITYSVFRDGSSTAAGTVLSSSTTNVGFTDTNLAPGSGHTYQVVASDGVNTSAVSPVSDLITVMSGSTPVFSDTFAAGFGAWASTTNLSLDATSGGAAPPSAKAQVSGQKAFAIATFAQSFSSLCASEGINLASIGTTSVAVLKLRTGTTSVARIFIDPGRGIKVRNDATGATFNPARTLATGWHSIELCATMGTGSSLRLSLDGLLIGTWVTALGTSPITGLQILDETAKTITVNVDDVLVHQ